MASNFTEISAKISAENSNSKSLKPNAKHPKHTKLFYIMIGIIMMFVLATGVLLYVFRDKLKNKTPKDPAADADKLYAYYCAEKQGLPPVKSLIPGGQSKAELVGCYSCVYGNCAFDANGPGDKNLHPNCDNKCASQTLSDVTIPYSQILGIKPSATNFNKLSLSLIGAYTATGTKMNVTATMTVSMTGDDRLIATMQVIDITSDPFKGADHSHPSVLPFLYDDLKPLLDKYQVAGPKFVSNQCGDGNANNNPPTMKVLTKKSPQTVTLDESEVNVIPGNTYGVYGVLGLATNNGTIYIKNGSVHAEFHS